MFGNRWRPRTSIFSFCSSLQHLHQYGFWPTPHQTCIPLCHKHIDKSTTSKTSQKTSGIQTRRLISKYVYYYTGLYILWSFNKSCLNKYKKKMEHLKSFLQISYYLTWVYKFQFCTISISWVVECRSKDFKVSFPKSRTVYNKLNNSLKLKISNWLCSPISRLTQCFWKGLDLRQPTPMW